MNGDGEGTDMEQRLERMKLLIRKSAEDLMEMYACLLMECERTGAGHLDATYVRVAFAARDSGKKVEVALVMGPPTGLVMRRCVGIAEAAVANAVRGGGAGESGDGGGGGDDAPDRGKHGDN